MSRPKCRRFFTGATEAPIRGELLVKWQGPAGWNQGEQLLRKDWVLASGATEELELSVPASPGDYTLRFICRGTVGDTILGEGKLHRHWDVKPTASVNLLRNGSFDLAQNFNGERMIQGEEFYWVFVKDKSGATQFTQAAEGWWSDNPSSTLVKSSSDGLSVTAEDKPVFVYSSPNLEGNGQPGRCAEHAAQIARLERWRSWIAGALAVLGLLWAATVTVVAAVIVERMKR